MATPVALFLGVLSIVLLLVLSGLVSGSEVAFFSLSDNDYKDVEERQTPAGRQLLALRDKPRRLLATILIANNFINIAIILVSDWLLKSLFPEALFEAWAAGLMEYVSFLSMFAVADLAEGIRFTITIIGVTFLLVLFGEVAPKVYARYNQIPLALFMAGPMKSLMRFFGPVAGALVNGAAVVERRFENRSSDSAFTQEDIDEAIDLTVQHQEGDEEGSTRQDVDILKRIVQFAGVTVRQIMRARGDVIAVDASTNYADLLTVIRENSYSRIPVFVDDFDKVKGLLYVKDLLGYRKEGPDFDWNQLVREEVLYVPENKRISELLKEFQLQKMHLAFVVDEYGGTQGIVTLEDVLEEVIGDIHDEFDDTDEIVYTRIDDLNYVFDGKTLLNDVCRIVDLPTSTFDEVKGEAESFAGLLLEMLGQFPEEDQEVPCGAYRFKVMKRTARRVEEILITLPAGEEG